MKFLALAAMLLAGSAQAATYKYTFIGNPLAKGSISDEWGDPVAIASAYAALPDTIAPLEIVLTINERRVPGRSLRNLSIDWTGSGLCDDPCPYPYAMKVEGLYFDLYGSYFHLEFDEDRRISAWDFVSFSDSTWVKGSNAFDGYAFRFIDAPDSVAMVDYGADGGSWTVSAVPLPAAGLLLLAGLGLLGMRRSVHRA